MYGPVLSVGLALGLVLSLSANVHARDDASLSVVSMLPAAAQTQVIDNRDLQSCSAGSLPRARCLPVGHFVDPTGKRIGFHAMRWLLGTIGLSGEETVLVIGDNATDSQMVGALLHQAGQRRVQMFDKPFVAPPSAPSGEPRSMSRETVFIAPMRDDTY